MALAALAATLTYVVAELGFTAVYGGGESVLVIETHDRAIAFRFDRVLGYRLPRTPLRAAYLEGERVVHRYVLRGNAQGLADRDDFPPARSGSGPPRLLVLGDSYTAASFLDPNWPDRVEDLTAARGRPLRLLNVAIDGGGLANWASILAGFRPLRQAKAADAVVVAVFEDDIDRPFHYRSVRRGRPGRVINYVFGDGGWDPPRSRGPEWDAPVYQLTRAVFERALQGRWKPPSRDGSFAPFFLGRARDLLDSFAGDRPDRFQPEQQALIRRMRRRLEARGWPCLVVRVDSPGDPDRGRAHRFAGLLGADYVDGDSAFKGLSPDEVAALWNGPDSHWGQEGSDRFARFVVPELEAWLARRGIGAGALESTAE